MRHSKLLHSAIRGTEGVRPITARDKPPTFVGGMHSTHCLYDTGKPRGPPIGHLRTTVYLYLEESRGGVLPPVLMSI